MLYSWKDIPSALNSLNFEAQFREALENWKSNLEDMDSRIADGDYYDYVWSNYTARAAESGMTSGQRGIQTNTGSVYSYNGAAWVFQFTYYIPLVRPSVTFSGCSEFDVVYFDGTNYQPALAKDAAIKETNLSLALTDDLQVWTYGPINVGTTLLPNGTYPAGTRVFLSDTTAGGFTTTDTGVPLGTSLGYGVLNFTPSPVNLNTKISEILDENDLSRFKGTITNADTYPDFPAGNKGDYYYVKTVAGKIGGASGLPVDIDDRLECIVDSSPSGDYATVGANWVLLAKPVIATAADAYDAVFDRPNNIKTGDYTVVWGDDVGETITLGSAATGDSSFTLPATDTDNDRQRITFINDSLFKLTIACNSADTIWTSDRGIELIDEGTLVTLQSDFSSNKWRIVEHAGGRVFTQGLLFYLEMNLMYGSHSSAYQTVAMDKTGFILMIVPNNSNTALQQGDLSCFGNGCFYFSTIPNSYLLAFTPARLNILNSKDGFTVSVFVQHITTTNEPTYFKLYVDASNYFRFYKNSAGDLVFELCNAGTVYSFSASAILTDSSWHHVALIQDTVGNLSIYLDGAQVAWLAESSYPTVDLSSAVNMYICQLLNGRGQVALITKGNPYGAAPNSGMTDSFTVPYRYLNMIMK